MSAPTAQGALWAMVLLPALVGGALATFRARRGAAGVAVVTAAVTTALAAVVAVERPTTAVPFIAGSDFALGLDALAALVAPAVAGVTLLVLVFAAGEIKESTGRFHGLMLLFAASALTTVTAQSLPALLFAWEVMGATSFALIGFSWREQHRVSAGITAFVTTRTADLGLYLAAGAALAGGAGLALDRLPEASPGWRDVIAAGVLVAALGKAAQLPFSFWLSRAMEGPSPVSALLHSAAMVAMGGYLLLRVQPLLAATGWADTAAVWLGALTALVLGAVALAQRDLKQLLAASTCAQLGFVVMGAGLGSVTGGATHLVAHASTKALLFLVAGAWLTALGTKQLPGLVGVARRWRLVGWTTTLGLLSLAGVAPMALWATKDSVLAAALKHSVAVYVVGLAAAALSAAYAGKVLVVMWRGVGGNERPDVERYHDAEQEGTRHVGALEQAPLVVLAAGAALLGLLALPPVGDALARALGEQPLHPTVWEMVLSALIALAVLGIVWRAPAWEPRWALGWLGLERITHKVAVRPTLVLAEALARFDDRVLDAGVDSASRTILRAGERSARGDDRFLDGTVERIAGWLRGLGQVARRPQTGLLHQYYIQAVAVVAIGVILLVTVG